MRVVFALGLLVLVFIVARYHALRLYRRFRGIPEPAQHGPRTTTIIVVALIIIYGLLLSYRIFTGDTVMH